MGVCITKNSKNSKNEGLVKYKTSNVKFVTTEIDMKVGPDIFVGLKEGNITSHYKIGEVLGEGNYAKVMLVTHKKTGLIRAMKTIKKGNIMKEEEEKLFSEMSILRGLDHLNISKLFELYQDENNYYMIIEYCNGGDFFDKIQNLNEFTEKNAANYLKQILSAVVYCHNNNIIHRDIKPENLLLDNKSESSFLKLIDFGNSRKFNSETKMTKRMGTPYYIAPEILSQNYNEKIDIWASGVIGYILLCGFPPFGGTTEKEILNSITEGKLSFEDEEWKNISNDAKDLISKMLDINPDTRLSAKEAIDHIWFEKNKSNDFLDDKCMENLTKFSVEAKFKNAILNFIATQIVSQNEKQDIMKTFQNLDKNGDGKLTKEELKRGYLQKENDEQKVENIVDKIFNELDTNKSGEIDFSEFLVAALNQEKLLEVSQVVMAFKMFDIDGNGYISRKELAQMMGGVELDDQTWNKILEEIEDNGDNQISQTEFIELLTKKKNI